LGVAPPAAGGAVGPAAVLLRARAGLFGRVGATALAKGVWTCGSLPDAHGATSAAAEAAEPQCRTAARPHAAHQVPGRGRGVLHQPRFAEASGAYGPQDHRRGTAPGLAQRLQRANDPRQLGAGEPHGGAAPPG
ncbi:unnamed protein product, partial [Effrenium voratum]